MCTWRNATIGQEFWETYSLVVNMLNVWLLLVIAHWHDLETESNDFVFAFPQADLDMTFGCSFQKVWFQRKIKTTNKRMFSN